MAMMPIGVVAVPVEIVTLKLRGRRQHDIGKRQVEVHWLSVAITVSSLRQPSIMRLIC